MEYTANRKKIPLLGNTAFNSKIGVPDKIIWVLTIAFFVSFTLLEEFSWGRYVFLSLALAVFVIFFLINKGKVWIKIGSFQRYLLIFMAYIFASSIWALNSADSIQKGWTLFEICICFSIFYFYYRTLDNIDPLISAIKWAGYIISIYTIEFYKLDNVMEATLESTSRLNNDYSNVNTIGMICALACMFQLYELLNKKGTIISSVFMIPAIIVIAATQSRKALLMLLGGLIGILVMRSFTKKNPVSVLFKLLIIIAFIGLFLWVLSNLELFTGINQRFQLMISGFIDKGQGDSSTLTRTRMVEVGIQEWLVHPILGIGIGNSHFLTRQYLNRDTYLHNNFVELLSGGGIIGFGIYYAMYIYLFCSLWKYRKVNYTQFSICFVWLLLMLILDYGYVGYAAKLQWFYLMVQFINIECLKHGAIRKNEYVKTIESVS